MEDFLTYGNKSPTLAQSLILRKHPGPSWIKEFEADAFAEELLMPEEILLDQFKTIYIKTKFNLPTTIRILVKLFGVEYLRLVRRLTRLKAI